ncbi:tetratricopeptide repeat protein [uncultured Algimonas sp.]|uniref:tetratricopeptide repeat protein n=1 Tax=uncultured Algimonas sp. TaxID=1547920 RepID=UPI00262220F5|nr:tetratricopeptide repeat protein [uncultured Algimonas sp.]
MVDFISEVEEELRKDDFQRFLRRFGPLIIGILVAIVAAVAYVEWREISTDRTARAASLDYLEADRLLQDGQADAARSAFLSLADVAPNGYAGLSLMRAAIIASEQGNEAEAVRLYDSAADRFDLERHAQLAALKAAYIVANRGDWSDVEQRASSLAQEGAPYEFLARELLATAALNQGDTERARSEFAYLDTVPGVPNTISRRAEQALVLMNTDRTTDETPILPAPADTAPQPDAAELEEARKE